MMVNRLGDKIPEFLYEWGDGYYHGYQEGQQDSRNRIQALIREFHTAAAAYSSPTPAFPPWEVMTLRWDLIKEELGELWQAYLMGDIIAGADALGDVLYTVYGCAEAMGIRDLDSVIEEIHRSNLTKDFAGGKHPITSKITKGPNYQPPQLEPILKKMGWEG